MMDSVICIFNPEHDLCLANGSTNYMPPESALRFAQKCADIMRILYPEASFCLPSPLVNSQTSNQRFQTKGPSERVHSGLECRNVNERSELTNQQITPWGWNAALRSQLIRMGVPEELLPSDQALHTIRRLQHRSTILPLQPQSIAATRPEEVESMIASHHAIVLKAPWSGSGRGLRWVTGSMSPHDLSWMCKVVKNQGCVIVEPRQQVASEFALEYHVGPHSLTFCGFSYFTATNGVYHSNLLLSDTTIRSRVGYTLAEQQALESWLMEHIVGQYQGPLGIDYLHTQEGQNILSEFNFRHTMGMVAHAYLQQHPEREGEEWVLTP